MYIKVLYNIKNNLNNKRGVVVQGARFDQKPIPSWRKKTKKGRKKEKKLRSERDLNPRPSDHRSCT